MTTDEILAVVMEDKEFYDHYGGGVTLSGGECLAQADFCAGLLKKLKVEGIHTAVDACGYVSRKSLDKVAPYTDIFLYDIKAYDEDVHIRCTRQSNAIILENLSYLNDLGKPIEIRIPYVPEFNADQILKIVSLLRNMNCLTKIKTLPYHNYAGSKYDALDMVNTLPDVLPTDEEIKRTEYAVFHCTQDN